MDMAASNRFSDRNAPALCRGCLSSHKRMKSIFNGPYDSLFRDVANIIVSETDGLPQWICWECVSTFHRFQIFKQKLIRTNQLLYECIHRCLPFQNDNDVKEQLMKHSTSTLAISKTFTLETIPKVGRGRIVNDVEVYSSVLLRPKDLKVPEDEVSIGENCIEIKPEKSEDEGVETGDWLCPVKYEDGVDYALAEADLKSEDDPDYTDPDDRPLLEKRPRRKRPRSPTYKPKKLKKIREKKNKSKHKYGPISDDDFFLQDDGAKRRTARKAIEVDPTKIRTIKLSLDKQIEQRKEDCKCGAYLKFPFKCALCFKGFNYEQKLTNHMRKHDRSRGEFECTLCSMYLPTIYSFNVHELTHSTRYECLKCGKIMIDKTSIIEHYSTVHEGVNITYVCSLCGKSSSNSKTHRGHMRNHHSGDRPKCDECGKTFVNKDSLNEHILIHTGVKNHVCEECGKRFRTKTQVKHHLLKHSEVRDFYCVECDMRFKSAHNLKQHLIKSQRHVDVDSLRYPCQRCNKRFDSERSLSHHVDFQHLGKRLHVCTTCGVALATRNSLMKHVRSAHEGYKAPLKHFCETCGKAFRARAVLIKHIRVHTGEKPYSCEHCARKFSHRSAMLTHIKLVHLKIKRFVNRSKKPAPILGRASSGHVSVSSDAPDVPTSIQTSPFAPVTAHPIITVKQDSSLIENRRLVIIQHSIGEENAFFAANT